MGYHFNFIYNRPGGKDTEDSEIALSFVEFLDGKISGWGYSCYIPDRDCLAGKNIFDELFKIVRDTEKTLVVITPSFRSNCWAKYSKQAAFKYLLEDDNQHKLIPIALNIGDNESLRELNVNEPIHIKGWNEDEWENNNRRCFDRLRKTFDESVQPRVVEEIGDNRLRTEERQQLVTRPVSESSLSSALSPDQEEEQSFLSVGGDSNTADSDVFLERSSARLQGAHEETRTETILYQRSELDQTDGANRQILFNQVIDGGTSLQGAHEETRTETILYQRSELDQTDGANRQLLSNQVTDGGTSLRNDVAGEMSTHRNLNSISDDNDLSIDVLPAGPTIGTENTTNTSVLRPETLGAESFINDTEAPELSFGSFEQDENDTVSKGSLDQDQTIPKRVTLESGYTTLSENSASPEKECSFQNQADDEKGSIPHETCKGSEATVRNSPENTKASGSIDEIDGSSTEHEGKKPSKGGTSLPWNLLTSCAYSFLHGELAFQ